MFVSIINMDYTTELQYINGVKLQNYGKIVRYGANVFEKWLIVNKT